jgi:glycosyltransferase involved in cell wall biosynthesis
MAARSATSVLCDSRSLLEAMRSLHLIRPNQGDVLAAGSACGVNTATFHPPSGPERAAARVGLGISDTAVLVGFVGRVNADKGVPELIEACKANRSGGLDVRLALIGPIEDPRALVNLDQASIADNWATVHGSQDDIVPLMHAFDIYCLPSHREGFPISTLEAMACGLPVITTTATGCIDSVIDGSTGITFPPGDSPALTNALGALIASPDRRRQLGNRGREWVVESFQEADVTERVIKYLESKVDEHNAAGSRRIGGTGA